MTIRTVAAAVVLAGTAAGAQPALLESGPGRIGCFETATEGGARLEDDKAVRLCIGAASDAPAQCATRAIEALGLSDESAVALCRTAESVAPSTCAAGLANRGYEDREIVEYCAALRWPLVPPPTTGAAVCVSAAEEVTTLEEQDVIRLCRGSRSRAPVDCYAAGEDLTTLSGRDLVSLCAPVVVASPRY